ncbi:MAG: hypothetical protein KAG61_08440 [Bacteriovoracaceae bacterium]|nr:hypothetical protein [Bacteriovoracaceae bacterium]
MRVLITYGGMLERIDGVRSISNTSSGATGAFLVNYFIGRDADVVVLKGKKATGCNLKASVHEFLGFNDLSELLEEALDRVSFDAVIHLAAVSDYTVDTVSIGGQKFSPDSLLKIDSEDDVSILLKKTPKLISRIREKLQDGVLVGFKLTNSKDELVRMAAIEKLKKSCAPDFIVHNDLNDISIKSHRTTTYNLSGRAIVRETKEELAALLYNLIEERVL